MIYWNRFISYIYRYHDNEKNENTGFAKVQKIANTGRMNIGLKDSMNRQDDVYSVYLYRETLADEEIRPGNNVQVMIPKPLYLGKLKMKGGRGEGTYTFDWNNVQESGKPITAWSGIIIKRLNGGNGQYGNDMFCSSWTDSIIDYSYMSEDENRPYDENYSVREQDIEQKTEKPEYIAAQLDMEYKEPAMSEPEDVEQRDFEQDDVTPDELEQEISASQSMMSEMETIYANPIEEMLDRYERLPLLPESGQEGNKIIESVKITPNDIGLLDMNNWRLGVNSFLTHGFYNYQYLMLGKIVFQDNQGSGSYVLGVPGVYSAKEKYLAGVFGFDRFIPGKETEIKTGSFGYWIVSIVG